MPKEYVVSGHSGTTDETFVIPFGISLVFYADVNETCYVPNNENALNVAIGSMRRFTFHKPRETVNDYEIDFLNDNYEGVAEIHRELVDEEKKEGEGKEGEEKYKETYSFFMNKRTHPNSLKLSELCNILLTKNQRKTTTLFCIFCRGSMREFANYDFGNFDNFEEGDFEEGDFEIGGNKKRRRKQTHRKRRKQTHKTYKRRKLTYKTHKRQKQVRKAHSKTRNH